MQQEQNLETTEENEIENLPIDVKTKLNDLIKKIDTIESVVTQLESQSFKDINSQVPIYL